MARFYGQVEGMASTRATRRGGADIKVSAQSWNGSVITKLKYNNDGVLIVEIETSTWSDFDGETIFKGTLEELKRRLKKWVILTAFAICGIG